MRYLLCLLLVPLMALASGPQWKWRDANGQIQYSDRPPPAGIPDRDILQRPVTRAKPVQIVPADRAAAVSEPASAASAASGPSAKERAAEAEKKKAEADAKAKEAAAQAEQRRRRAENCEQARARLAEINSGQRMSSMNANGEREVWDDARRAAERQRAQQVAAESCR